MSTFQQLAADSFNRPNAALTTATANLWKTLSTANSCNIVSNGLQCQVLNALSANFYSGIGQWSADQYSEVTILTLNNANAFFSPLVRCSSSAFTDYLLLISGPFASAQFTFYKRIAGTTTALSSAMNFPTTLKSGDVIRFAAQGTILSVYQNGTLAGSISDGSITTGFPGVRVYVQTGGVLSDVVVSGWAAGYLAADQPMNLWRPQGQVISGNFGNPSVIYESGAQILSGTVFKMWFGAGTTCQGLNYAESNDGINWVAYVSNPIITAANTVQFPRVFKSGSTYYAYFANAVSNACDAYTSANGLTWTLAQAGAITTNQAWETGRVGPLSVMYVDGGGTWWAYYENIAVFPTANAEFGGLATSSNGLTWTKNPSNPIFQWSNSDYGFVVVPPNFYAYSASDINGQATLIYQSPIFRFKASSPGGPWTRSAAPVLYESTVSGEGLGPTSILVAPSDPAFLEVNGKAYCYYTVTIQGAAWGVGLFIAPNGLGATVATISEGIANVPIPSNNVVIGPNQSTQSTDNFTRANANPIGGNWTTLSTAAGWGAAQLVSNSAQGLAINQNADCYWNAAIWSANQWAQITVGVCSAAYVGIGLRMNTSGVATEYRFNWFGTSGGSGTASIVQIIGGTAMVLNSSNLTVSTGDVLMAVANGENLYFYWNGFLFLSATDPAITSGAAGFNINAGAGAVGNASVTGFSGGMIMAIPASGGGGDLGPGFDFRFRM